MEVKKPQSQGVRRTGSFRRLGGEKLLPCLSQFLEATALLGWWLPPSFKVHGGDLYFPSHVFPQTLLPLPPPL